MPPTLPQGRSSPRDPALHHSNTSGGGGSSRQVVTWIIIAGVALLLLLDLHRNDPQLQRPAHVDSASPATVTLPPPAMGQVDEAPPQAPPTLSTPARPLPARPPPARPQETPVEAIFSGGFRPTLIRVSPGMHARTEHQLSFSDPGVGGNDQGGGLPILPHLVFVPRVSAANGTFNEALRQRRLRLQDNVVAEAIHDHRRREAVDRRERKAREVPPDEQSQGDDAQSQHPQRAEPQSVRARLAQRERSSSELAARHPEVDTSREPNVVLLPLLIYLHGAGEIGRDVFRLLRSVPAKGSIPQVLASHKRGTNWEAHHPLLDGSFPAVVIMPQASTSWRNADAIAAVRTLVEHYMHRAAFEIHDDAAEKEGVVKRRQKSTTTRNAGSDAAPDLLNGLWVHSTTRLLSKTVIAIDHNRIFVTGASNGGHGAYRLHLAMERTFAAVVPVCGFLSATDDEQVQREEARDLCRSLGHRPVQEVAPVVGASGLPDAVKARAIEGAVRVAAQCDVGLYLAHGSNDQIVPVSASDVVATACVAEGLADDCLHYVRQVMPDADDGTANGHAAWIVAYAARSKLWEWLHLRHSTYKQ